MGVARCGRAPCFGAARLERLVLAFFAAGMSSFQRPNLAHLEAQAKAERDRVGLVVAASIKPGGLELRRTRSGSAAATRRLSK